MASDEQYALSVAEAVLARFGDRGPGWRGRAVEDTGDGFAVVLGGRARAFFRRGGDRAEAVAVMAGQIQDHELGEVRGTPLPPCPGHHHPLVARVVGGNPLWVCPADDAHHRDPVVEADWAAALPRLFARQRWSWGGIDARFTTVPPEADEVTNVHLVGTVGDLVVVCRDTSGRWFLPGGTREPGESVRACADRELAEEAGARVVGPLRAIGVHHGVTDRPAPHRPHLPHPRSAWLWCAAEISLDGSPTNPPDGEQVEEVRACPPDEAAALLAPSADWYGELITLAGVLWEPR